MPRPTWKSVLVLFLLFGVFSLFLFPRLSARLTAYSGLANPSLDGQFRYTPQEAFARVAAYGEAGRRLYALGEVTLDLAYPILYSLLLNQLLALGWGGALGGSSPAARWLPRLPLAVLAADYAENACIVSLLLLYPRQPEIVARLASLFTPLKWSLAGLAVALALLGLAAWLWTRIFPGRARFA